MISVACAEADPRNDKYGLSAVIHLSRSHLNRQIWGRQNFEVKVGISKFSYCVHVDAGRPFLVVVWVAVPTCRSLPIHFSRHN